jgi:hypothetical protein
MAVPFVDQMLLQLHDAEQLTRLLAPAGDPRHARLHALLNAGYDMPFATLHEVRGLKVRQLELQRPLFPPRRKQGTWTQTTPSYTRTDVAYDSFNWQAPVWLDMAVEVELTLVLEVDPGQVAAIITREIAHFDNLNDFRARFRFIDLDAFMAKHRISTVEELRETANYLLTEIHLRAPAPFDPNDPANEHLYTLNLAILIRDVIDLKAALRDAKLTRAILERTLTYRQETDTAEVRTPYAPIIIFPETGLGSLNADALKAIFASERILALFTTPL